MLTMRLAQRGFEGRLLRVALTLVDETSVHSTAESSLACDITAQDREDLRWYLEDYPAYAIGCLDASEPEQLTARRIESRLNVIGSHLHRQLFEANDASRALWSAACTAIDDTAVEILMDPYGDAAVLWELIRDPQRSLPLALEAKTLIHWVPPSQVAPPPEQVNVLRVLLVIARPYGLHDVPYRAVGAQVQCALTSLPSTPCRLQVLRPPTIQRLSDVLLAAARRQEPYHILHFDGHGVPAPESNAATSSCLVFEHSASWRRNDFLSATRLAQILRDAGVRAVVLNSCRSASRSLNNSIRSRILILRAGYK